MSDSMGDPGRSWNGPPPELSMDVLPLDLPVFSYPPNFANDFNKNPVETFVRAKQEESGLENAHYAGPFLFHCKGIWPVSITNLVFNRGFPLGVNSFLYFYFSSITLDYMRLADAAAYCLSRIALPDNVEQLNMIFYAFADAYFVANPYINIKVNDIATIAKACVIRSGYQEHCDNASKEFLSLLSAVHISQKAKEKIFQETSGKPIPLFFTFTNFSMPPEYNKSGMLKKIGGLFKTKKDRLFVIKGFVLKYYHDKSMKQQIGELDISGTISSFEPKQKKDSEHLLIKNKDGGSIGFKISKDGVRKKSNHNDYIAYADKVEDIMCWKATLNLVAFWKMMYDLLGPQ